MLSVPIYAGSTLQLATPAPEPMAGADDEPLFRAAQLEELTMRRGNPLKSLNAETLTAALDSFDVGDFGPAARLWQKIADRERLIMTVKPKREEAIALRPWVVEALEESPEAEDQKAIAEAFFNGLRASHALNRHISGGFSLLVQQMMESVSYFYATHHLRWQPDALQTIKLPGGGDVPTLGLTAEYVPLEYFEGRIGELRFLGVDQGYTGQPLAPRRWMTTTGPGLMRSASIAIWEGRLARHDRLNLSGKWSQPAVLGHTTAAKASDSGKAMKTAVASVASNYRGVIYGSDRNAIETVWPTGGSGSGNTPMKEIMDDVRREVVTLYIGSDLSTVSRGGSEQSVGASVQGESEADRQRADCQRISETLTTVLLPIVIAWYFGENARVLVKLVIEAPDNEDRSKLGEAVKTVVELGGEVPVAPVAKRLNVPLAKAGDVIFRKPSPAAATHLATNRADGPVVGKFMATARDLFARRTAEDLQPLRSVVARVLQQFDDASRLEAARRLYAALPQLAQQIIPAQGNAEALYQILSVAAAEGLTRRPS